MPKRTEPRTRIRPWLRSQRTARGQSQAEGAAWQKAEALDPTLATLARRGLALLEHVVPSGHVDRVALSALVAAQALVQARNTLRAAWLVSFDGFEIQALALARLVTEYVVLCWYARAGLGDPAVWLQTEQAPPTTGEQLRALEAHARTGAVPPEYAAVVAAMRKFLHRLAHQDPLAFAFTYRVENARPSFFRTAGSLDTVALRRAGEYLLPLTMILLDAAGGAGPERDALDREVDAWWEIDEPSPTIGR